MILTEDAATNGQKLAQYRLYLVEVLLFSIYVVMSFVDWSKNDAQHGRGMDSENYLWGLAVLMNHLVKETHIFINNASEKSCILEKLEQ